MLALISRFDVAVSSNSQKYTEMKRFQSLIERCLGAKIWKVRAMAARCLHAVLDPDDLSEEISDIFAKVRGYTQNQLHGVLMGIKCLGEVYSQRAIKDTVFGTVCTSKTEILDAIISGMHSCLDLVLRENRNPLTKAAFVEIVHLVLRNEDKANGLKALVVSICVEDIRLGINSTIGWQWYLEQVATLALQTLSNEPSISEARSGDILRLLLSNPNEEVVLKTLSWLNESAPKGIFVDSVQQALWGLITQDKWDGVCAMALRAMSNVIDGHERISLETCITEYHKNDIMPVKEGWITVAGYAARMVNPLSSI